MFQLVHVILITESFTMLSKARDAIVLTSHEGNLWICLHMLYCVPIALSVLSVDTCLWASKCSE